MIRLQRTRWCVCLLISAFGAVNLLVQHTVNGQEQEPTDASGVKREVVPLESGPIHEAFAEAIRLDTVAPIVVPQQPPEPVPELPPELRPEGDNVIWIPGYWAWSQNPGDFIWISGVWRDAPPGQRWVPGYWTEAAEGYQWTRGFWTAGETEELVYLPAPPESLETRPTSPRPSSDYFWIPGCWRWRDGQYYWRGGFWHPAQENWIWIPAHYRYTPRGYVYRGGYWDHPLPRRGLLFAPVYFRDPIYRRSGYFYTPTSWIDVALLTTSLFVSPRHGHYFYGNYYGPEYHSAGFYPWYEYHDRRFGYDPLFAYSSWRHGRADSDWFEDLRNEYRRRGGGAAEDQDRQVVIEPDEGREPRQLVQKISQLREKRGESLLDLDEEQRRQALESARDRFGDFRRQRAKAEAQSIQDRPPQPDRSDEARVQGVDRSKVDSSDQDRSGVGQQSEDADTNQSERPGNGQAEQEHPRVAPSPEAGQSTEGQQKADQRIERRPSGPVKGRFRLPEISERRIPPVHDDQGIRGPQESRDRVVPQLPQRPVDRREREDVGRQPESSDAGRIGSPQSRGDSSDGREQPREKDRRREAESDGRDD